MYRHTVISFLLFSIALFANKAANANSIEVSTNIYHFNYQEFDTSNQSLNQEKGYLPGIKLEFNHAYKESHFIPYISLQDGTANYRGNTQNGQPHRTKTEEQILQLGLDVIGNKLEKMPLHLIFGFRYWQWDRNILTKNNTLGLHEVYTWNEFNLGIRLKTKIQNNSFYWANISALHTFDPDIKIFLENTKETLDMKSKNGFRVHIGKSWNNNQKHHFSISIISEFWEFGRSNSVFTNDFFGSSTLITEPRSESFNTGIELKYTHHFK